MAGSKRRNARRAAAAALPQAGRGPAVSPGFFFRTLLRESRGARSRLGFFIACLSVGVAAVVAVAGLSSAWTTASASEARQLLAADLSIEGNRPLPPDFDLAPAGLPGRRPHPSARDGDRGRRAAADRRRRPAAGAQPARGAQGGRGEYPFYGVLDLRPRAPAPRRS